MPDVKKKEDIYLSIIISFFNEGPRIEKTLRRIDEFVDSQKYKCEVILSDDRSTDDSIAVAKTFADDIDHFEYLEPIPGQGKGKGAGLKRGFQAASGKYVMFMDADNSTDIFEVEKLLPFAEKDGYDIVMGSRYIKEPHPYKPSYIGAVFHGIKSVLEVLIFGHALDYQAKGKQGRLRQLISRGGNLIFTVFLNQSYVDQRCGFKLYKSSVAKFLSGLQTLDGFGFDTEYLAIAQKYHFKTVEVPVDWYDEDKNAKYGLSSALKEFKDMFIVLGNLMSGKYAKKNLKKRTGKTYEEHILNWD